MEKTLVLYLHHEVVCIFQEGQNFQPLNDCNVLRIHLDLSGTYANTLPELRWPCGSFGAVDQQHLRVCVYDAPSVSDACELPYQHGQRNAQPLFDQRSNYSAEYGRLRIPRRGNKTHTLSYAEALHSKANYVDRPINFNHIL